MAGRRCGEDSFGEKRENKDDDVRDGVAGLGVADSTVFQACEH